MNEIIKDKSLLFEPRFRNKFMVAFEDEETKAQIISPELIKYIEKPTCSMDGNNKVWKNITVKIYDSFYPKDVYISLIKANVFHVVVKEFSLNANIMNEWQLWNCKFSSIYASPLDWDDTNQASEIIVEIDWSKFVCDHLYNEFEILRHK